MKLIYTLLIQFILIANIHCQNLMVEYAENNYYRYKTIYSYNEQNQRIESVESTHDKASKRTSQRWKTEWRYENDKLLLERIYNYVGSNWVLFLEYENTYDDDGCNVEKKRRRYLQSNSFIGQTITIVNQFDCSEPWKNDEDHLSDLGGNTNQFRVTRKRTDTSELETYFVFSESAQTWGFRGVIERKYNQKNKVLEEINSFSHNGYVLKEVYTYDATGENVLTFEAFLGLVTDGGGIVWSRTDQEEYIYEVSLLRKKKIGYGGDFFEEHLYEYYCDGLLKEIRRDCVEEEFVFVQPTCLWRFNYDQKVMDSENCEQLENLELKIYPNPIKDFFYIESDIFQNESSEILIYNTLGKLLHRHEIADRVTSVQIQLGSDVSLNNMLIVHLISEGGYSISKKVFVGKLHR